MTASRPVALTPRDRALIQAACSLGYATAATLRALVSPATSADTLRARLRRLHRAGHLVQVRYVAPAGALWLYGVGRRSLAPSDPAPWRPGLAQVQHTLAVSEAVVALTRPGFAAPLSVTGWQGEAELRAWATPGWPYPDARVTWRSAGSAGAWLVEVDRATEARAAWRRKLVRYLTAMVADPVLLLTTSTTRAAGIAALSANVGVPMLAAALDDVLASADPRVLDTRTGRWVALSAAIDFPSLSTSSSRTLLI